jgi:hypothetical protein
MSRDALKHEDVWIDGVKTQKTLIQPSGCNDITCYKPNDIKKNELNVWFNLWNRVEND